LQRQDYRNTSIAQAPAFDFRAHELTLKLVLYITSLFTTGSKDSKWAFPKGREKRPTCIGSISSAGQPLYFGAAGEIQGLPLGSRMAPEGATNADLQPPAAWSILALAQLGRCCQEIWISTTRNLL